MKRERQTFQRDGYTLVVDTTSGERVVYRVRDGEELPKKQPRRIEPKRTNQPKREQATPQRVNRRDCVHLDGSAGETTKHLCGGCPGGQVATIFQCELFGECLPAAWAPTPDSTARRCVDCGKYEKALLPAPPAE